jgi:hypothetical protein
LKLLLSGFALLALCAVLYLEGGMLFGMLLQSEAVSPPIVGLLGLFGVILLLLLSGIAVILIMAGFVKLVWIPMPKEKTPDGNGRKGGDA